jgi:hypothetical protein
MITPRYLGPRHLHPVDDLISYGSEAMRDIFIHLCYGRFERVTLVRAGRRHGFHLERKSASWWVIFIS